MGGGGFTARGLARNISERSGLRHRGLCKQGKYYTGGYRIDPRTNIDAMRGSRVQRDIRAASRQ
jgi:hypothetical protein